jgi:hypothetical protein
VTDAPASPDGPFKALAESTTVLVVSRIAQMLGIPIGLFLLAWMFNTIQGTRDAVTTLTTQMLQMSKDPYTATDARHDFAVEDVRLQALDRRVGVLESAPAGAFRPLGGGH